jgi:hypothetical protein
MGEPDMGDGSEICIERGTYRRGNQITQANQIPDKISKETQKAKTQSSQNNNAADPTETK